MDLLSEQSFSPSTWSSEIKLDLFKAIQDLASNNSITDFESLTSHNNLVKRNAKPKMPVVFMPEKSKVECERVR